MFRILFITGFLIFVAFYVMHDDRKDQGECAGKCPIATEAQGTCYAKFGACLQKESSCQWKITPKLQNCLDMVIAAENIKDMEGNVAR